MIKDLLSTIVILVSFASFFQGGGGGGGWRIGRSCVKSKTTSALLRCKT